LTVHVTSARSSDRDFRFAISLRSADILLRTLLRLHERGPRARRGALARDFVEALRDVEILPIWIWHTPETGSVVGA